LYSYFKTPVTVRQESLTYGTYDYFDTLRTFVFGPKTMVKSYDFVPPHDEDLDGKKTRKEWTELLDFGLLASGVTQRDIDLDN